MPIFSKTNPARRSGRIRQSQMPVTLRAASVVFASALSTFVANAVRAAEDQAVPDQPVKAAELEEIVVTARYRAESLQDTPISISALSAADLEARGHHRRYRPDFGNAQHHAGEGRLHGW